MKLRPDQLQGQLQKRLLPVYLVFGDEPLLVQESVAVIRRAGMQQGYDERECYYDVDGSFDWDHLNNQVNTASLFAERRLVELHLVSGKLGDRGGKQLKALCEQPPHDIVLLVIGGKFEQSVQRSRWVSTIESNGAIVRVWPVDYRQLPAWIEQRLRAKGLNADTGVAQLLASRVESNLLAAAQEIDKLALLFGSDRFNEADLLALVADHARYGVFDAVDAALAGNPKRTLRICNHLRDDNSQGVLLVWALQREVQLLLELHSATEHRSLAQAMQQLNVWEKRKPLVKKAYDRHNVENIYRLISYCATLDRVAKGAQQGDFWQLAQIGLLALAGVDVIHPVVDPELWQMAATHY